MTFPLRHCIMLTVNKFVLLIYRSEQRNISMIVNRIVERLGIERSYEPISIFNDIASEISLINDEMK